VISYRAIYDVPKELVRYVVSLLAPERDGLPHLILDGKVVDADRLHHTSSLSAKARALPWEDGQ
jgi:hypothetical protein